MKCTMDTPNQFKNGNMVITVGVTQHDDDAYLYLMSKSHIGKSRKRFIDMTRSQALQLARAIEVVAESLPEPVV